MSVRNCERCGFVFFQRRPLNQMRYYMAYFELIALGWFWSVLVYRSMDSMFVLSRATSLWHTLCDSSG